MSERKLAEIQKLPFVVNKEWKYSVCENMKDVPTKLKSKVSHHPYGSLIPAQTVQVVRGDCHA